MSESNNNRVCGLVSRVVYSHIYDHLYWRICLDTRIIVRKSTQVRGGNRVYNRVYDRVRHVAMEKINER